MKEISFRLVLCVCVCVSLLNDLCERQRQQCEMARWRRYLVLSDDTNDKENKMNKQLQHRSISLLWSWQASRWSKTLFVCVPVKKYRKTANLAYVCVCAIKQSYSLLKCSRTRQLYSGNNNNNKTNVSPLEVETNTPDSCWSKCQLLLLLLSYRFIHPSDEFCL